MAALAALVQATPFAKGVPLAVAVCQDRITELVRGQWPDGRAVVPTDRFYAASLAKQLTGAAIALLVKQGRLDPVDRLGQFLPDLPGWLQQATLLQVLGHIAGLPPGGELEYQRPNEDWTTARALATLHHLPMPANALGSRFAYANVGYVVLACIVEQASGMDFASFAQEALFKPLALSDLAFAPAGEVMQFAQTAGMGPGLPLSHGDGGLWTTARDFVRWLAAQNRDALGIADLVETPAHLSDETLVDYGWGIGLRTYQGEPLFIHGGSWSGACCKAVRSRALGVSIAVFAAREAELDNVGTLVDAILAAATKDAHQ